MSDAKAGAASSSGAGATADDRSREQVLAEREAAREAKKAAKAAKAAKAGKKGSEGPTEGGQTTAPVASTSKDKADAKQVKKAPKAEAQASSSSASAQTGSQGNQRAHEDSKKSARTVAPEEPVAPELRNPMLPPNMVGGVNLFSNVIPAKHPKDVRQLIVAASMAGTIHPSILQLAQHLASYSIVGANARAIAALRALRDVVLDYRVPPGETLTRDLIAKLKPQIDVLQRARPLGVSVAHAIRYLKFEISNTDNRYDEHEAKAHIVERIDHFVRDRITYATQAIAAKVAHDKIRDGDVVLTYGKSSVVEHTLIEAKRRGIDFHVIVVDARPQNEGRRLLASLESEGIACTYGLIASLSVLVRRASLVLLGTASLLGNGALYARSGTAACAMAAHAQGAPVIVCCETYKFSEQIRLDAFSLNEAAPPTELLGGQDIAKDQLISSQAAWEKQASDSKAGPNVVGLLNLMYDVTPPRFVTAVASEVGFSTPESVGVILRDYKSVLYVQ